MSTFVGLRPLNRSAKIGVGSKDVTTGKTTYVNIDNKRVARDLARHSTLGQTFQVGSFYSNDDGVVEVGGTVTPAAASLVMNVSALSGTRASGAAVSHVADTVTLAAAHATLPRLDAVLLDTATPDIVKLDGTATANADLTNRIGLTNTGALAANRALLALVLVPPARAITAEADDNLVTLTAHGFTAGQAVWFSALTGGTGLAINTLYYVHTVASANTFSLTATPGGSVIDITVDATAGNLTRQLTSADVADVRP